MLLALLLGSLGVHNFYAGRRGVAFGQLVSTAALCWTIIIPLVNAMVAWGEMLCVKTDGYGRPMV